MLFAFTCRLNLSTVSGRIVARDGLHVSFAACNVVNAKTYSSGCLLSSCDAGWKVSDDKTKCLANICLCPNGIAATGAKCVSDEAKICESCDAGFKPDKRAGITVACTGKLYCRIHVHSSRCASAPVLGDTRFMHGSMRMLSLSHANNEDKVYVRV